MLMFGNYTYVYYASLTSKDATIPGSPVLSNILSILMGIM